MLHCPNCGCEFDSEERACPHCGTVLPVSFGWTILGFCLPIIGLILYVLWKETKPQTCSRIIKGVIAYVIVSIIFGVIPRVLSLLF